MMPPLFDVRSDIANELLQAHHAVVSLFAGPISEELFTGERLPAADISALICRSASALTAEPSCARANGARSRQCR
jgi:hypothetical protein